MDESITVWLAAEHRHQSDPFQPEKKKALWRMAGEDIHSYHKVFFHLIVLMNVLHWTKSGENKKQKSKTVTPSGNFTFSYKTQNPGALNESSPPWSEAAPNEWPLQLELPKHSLYSSCMCGNYKSLKSHFESTIKTLLLCRKALPPHKNLRPGLQQQDIDCQPQTA